MVRTNDFHWLEWLYWWEQNERRTRERERETEDETGVGYIIF